MKISHKARHGRKRNPTPHKSHHRPTEYSRVGRLLKQRVALMLAPKVSDFDLDRPRLGLTDLSPLASGVHILPVNSARAASTAGRPSHGGTP